MLDETLGAVVRIQNLSISEALWLCLLGLAVVMAVLVVISFIIRLLAAAINASGKGGAEPVSSAPVPVPAPTAVANASEGSLALYDVDDKSAVMIMAIVANKMNAPIYQLRFKSIKRVD